MKKGVVVDLDGTLLSTNTFKEYIIFSCKEAIKCHFFYVLTLIFFWVIIRKIRLIKHDVMKYHVLHLTKFYMTQTKIEIFTSIIVSKINNSILCLLRKLKKKKYTICLSTAAPGVYVKPLSEYLSSVIDFIVTTPMPSGNFSWHENVRQVKADNTIKLLNQNGIQLKILITDHHDDIPLLLIKKDSNILVSPSKRTISKLRAFNIEYSIF
jgi:phosphoserine phosphatase